VKAADATRWVNRHGHDALVEQVVATAPPLTADQRARLAAILSTAGAPTGGGAS